MRPSEILASHRAQIKAAVERHRLRNPRVFGSAMRGEDSDGSDLDLLVDACEGATLFDLAAAEAEIETITGARVDLMTPGFLPERWRMRALEEAVPL